MASGIGKGLNWSVLLEGFEFLLVGGGTCQSFQGRVTMHDLVC